jgi:hypothetical protein
LNRLVGGDILRRAILFCLLVTSGTEAQLKDLPVEVVASATEYIQAAPTTQPSTQSEHSRTDCSGNTSYIGDFANTHISCSSTSTTGSTEGPRTTVAKGVTNAMGGGLLTGRPKTRYVVVKSDHAVHLLSCTEHWRWSKCPVWAVGEKYLLTIDNSDVRLNKADGNMRDSKPVKLEYLSSALLPLQDNERPPLPTTAAGAAPAKVHITSTPSGGEISVDGKFYGTTPSDITLLTGEHLVKVRLGSKEWSRSVEVTAGEISLHADMPDSK